MTRERNRKREGKKEEAPTGGIERPDCPCPKKQCKNYMRCTPCREKHKKSKPYCER